MFPGAGANVYRNEVGEPIGWDYSMDDEVTFYCDMCGFSHAGVCPDPYDEEDQYCANCGGEAGEHFEECRYRSDEQEDDE